jgi:hypothetical protein
MATPETGTDDLTRITGIGTKIARRLSEAGVGSYADLASRSADEIVELLPDVSALPVTRVDGWRREAGRLAATRPAPVRPAAPGNDQHYESYLVRVLLNVDGSVRRTTVRHVGTGAERHWAGLGGEALVDFIRASADFPGPPVPAGEAVPAADAAPAQGEAHVPSASSAVLSVERTTLRASAPFSLKMTFDLGELPAGASRLGYRALIVAKPLGSGPRRTVAQSDGLIPAETPVISIDAAGLPAGAYRLDGVVTLSVLGRDRPLGLTAIAEGLLVQVLPV